MHRVYLLWFINVFTEFGDVRLHIEVFVTKRSEVEEGFRLWSPYDILVPIPKIRNVK